MAETNTDPQFDRADCIAAARSGDFETFVKNARQRLDDTQWAALNTHVLDAYQAGEIDLPNILSARKDVLNLATQRLLEQLLPSFELDLVGMIGLIEGLSTRTRGGQISHYILQGFAGWCEAKPGRLADALAAVRAGAIPDMLWRTILVCGLRVDRDAFLPAIVEMLERGAPAEKSVSASVLGRFDQFTADELNVAAAALEAALAIPEDDQITEPLRGLLAIALRDPAHSPLGMRILAAMTERPSSIARQAVATELMFDIARAPDQLAAAGLRFLEATEASEHATIEAIDHILAHDLGGRLAAERRILLDTLLARGSITMTMLDAVAHDLVADPSFSSSTQIVDWLASDKLRHVLAVRDLCDLLFDSAPRFSLDFSALAPKRAARVARRTCVILLHLPDTIASILVSLLRTGPGDIAPMIEELLFDPLLLNYWHGPRRYLDTVRPDAPGDIAAVIDRVTERLDRYIAEVEGAGDLIELRPSERRRFLSAMKRHEDSVAMAKQAQQTSQLAEIFPTAVLLYGDCAVFDTYPVTGSPVRTESPLHSFEVSHELPRLDVIDPFGSWFQRDRLLRGEEDQ